MVGCYGMYRGVRRSLGVLFLLLILMVTPIDALAYNIGSPHNVNQSLDMAVERKNIWSNLRSKGYSEEATAGIMGNFGQESGCNRTVTQGGRSWSSFSYGRFGIGLAQWTSSGRQKNLFAVADKHGKQWMDLEVQLEHFENEMKTQNWKGASSSVNSLEDFKKLKNIDEATVVFEDVFERAGKPNIARRKQLANQYFKELTGTEVSSSSEDTEESTEEEVKTQAFKIVDEWDLTGMPSKSGILGDAKSISLPTYDDLTTGEKYSMSVIKSDISRNDGYGVIDNIRVGVVFCGLLCICYGVFILVAYLFDRVNVFIDISLIGILTLGRVRYTDEEYLIGKEGYASGGKVVKIALASFAVGVFLVSGGIFNIILRVFRLVASI